MRHLQTLFFWLLAALWILIAYCCSAAWPAYCISLCFIGVVYLAWVIQNQRKDMIAFAQLVQKDTKNLDAKYENAIKVLKEHRDTIRLLEKEIDLLRARTKEHYEQTHRRFEVIGRTIQGLE